LEKTKQKPALGSIHFSFGKNKLWLRIFAGVLGTK